MSPQFSYHQHTKYVRDLGIYIDSDMSMKTHVSRTVSSCFAAFIAPSASQSYCISLRPWS